MNIFNRIKQLFGSAQPVQTSPLDGKNVQAVWDDILQKQSLPTKMTLVYDLDYETKKASVVDVQSPEYRKFAVDLDEQMIDELKTNPQARKELEQTVIEGFKQFYKDQYE